MIVTVSAFYAPLADGITSAGSLVLGVLFSIAGVATAFACVRVGITLIQSQLLHSSASWTESLFTLFGIALGVLVTLSGPQIARTVLEMAGPAQSFGSGPFAGMVADLIRLLSRLAAVIAACGYVYFGVEALVDMAARGTGFGVAQTAHRYVGITLALIAVWQAPAIVNALAATIPGAI